MRLAFPLPIFAKRCANVAAAFAGALTVGVTLVGPATAADLDYGKPGSPVTLTIGYQPYYTESWSGIVMRGKKMYEKYLPAGSKVEFAIGLQGAVIVNAMLAGKQDIGYMGDMPAIVSTTKQSVADIRLVANLGMGSDQCNIFLARPDAPDFKDGKEAIKWLNGKRIAVPKGSCTDRFAQAVFRKESITPEAYLNQNIEVITSGFRAGKLDAAVIWEPTASRLVQEGLAKRIASGATVGENDAGFLAMRADLIKQRPDVVKAWLNAELDAQLFLADSKNAMEIAAMAAEQATGFTEKMLWASLYGKYPESAGGTPVRLHLHYSFTPEATKLISEATIFLHSIKSIDVDKLRAEAVMPEFTLAILKERGLTAPIGKVNALDASEFKK
ncbi:MAG: NrtA/SsuA/CpmA family ABC transporter substrate-binding protein [Rhizobacter sp.]|nr:NrtA/SsuA/CpmA family ABC transporter substrate-binding protein [Rhizobacter sp.]